MLIRKTTNSDLDSVMAVYAHAREFMATQGNPHQWGDSNWPYREVIEEDIAIGKSYICEHNNQIAAVFFYDYGERIEPTYNSIDGAWRGGECYGVVHRIASAHITHGAGRACLSWAIEQSQEHLRIDTHKDNIPMQNLLTSMGFARCGIIMIEGHAQSEPRIAFEYLARNNLL